MDGTVELAKVGGLLRVLYVEVPIAEINSETGEAEQYR